MERQALTQLLLINGLPKIAGIRLFFSTRQGGFSHGDFASFNQGTHVGDDLAIVQKNRRRLMEALAPDIEKLFLVNQVHGCTTVLAGDPEAPLVSADAMVTRQKRLGVAVLTADCAPVLFADIQAGVVGAAHAGWRGAQCGILESCLDQMTALGARKHTISAFVGPCIRADNYEVDADFKARFLEMDRKKIGMMTEIYFSNAVNACKFLFDLPAYVRARLQLAGIAHHNIYDLGLCTYRMNELFFSYRRSTHSGKNSCGRQMGGIALVQ